MEHLVLDVFTKKGDWGLNLPNINNFLPTQSICEKKIMIVKALIAMERL